MVDARVFMLIGFGIGMTAALALRDCWLAEVDHVLTFAGVVIGVAGAVYAGRKIEEHKIELEKGRGLQRLNEAVEMAGLIQAFRAPTVANIDLPPAQQDLAHRYIWLERAGSALQYSMSHTTLDDIGLFTLLAVLQNSLASRLAAVGEFRAALMRPIDPQIVARQIEHFENYAVTIQKQVDQVRPHLKAALEAAVRAK